MSRATTAHGRNGNLQNKPTLPPVAATADATDAWPLPRGLFPFVPSSPITPIADDSDNNSYTPFQLPVETRLHSPTAYFKRQRLRRRELQKQQQQQRLQENTTHQHQVGWLSEHGMTEQKQHLYVNPQQQQKFRGDRHVDTTSPAASGPNPWPVPPPLPTLTNIQQQHHQHDENDMLDDVNSNSDANTPSPIITFSLDSHHLLTNAQGLQQSPQTQPLALRTLPSVAQSTDDSFHTPPESASEDFDSGAVLERMSRMYPPAPEAPTFADSSRRKSKPSKSSDLNRNSTTSVTAASPFYSESDSSSSSGSDSVIDVLDLFADVRTREETADEPTPVESVRIHCRSSASSRKGSGDTTFLNAQGLRSLFSDDALQGTQYYTKKNIRRSKSDLANSSERVVKEFAELARSSSSQQVNERQKERSKRRQMKKAKKAKNQASSSSDNPHDNSYNPPHENDLESTTIDDKAHPKQHPSHQQGLHQQQHSHLLHYSTSPNIRSPPKPTSPAKQDLSKSFSSTPGRTSPTRLIDYRTRHKPSMQKTTDHDIVSSSNDLRQNASTSTIALSAPRQDLPPADVRMSSIDSNASALTLAEDNSIQRQTSTLRPPNLRTMETPAAEIDANRAVSTPRGRGAVVVRDAPKRPPYQGIRRAETGFIMSHAELQLDGAASNMRDNPNPKSFAFIHPLVSGDARGDNRQRRVKDEYTTSSSSGMSGSSSADRTMSPPSTRMSRSPISLNVRPVPTSSNSSIFDEPVSRTMMNLSVTGNAGSVMGGAEARTGTGTGADGGIMDISGVSNNLGGSSGVERVTGGLTGSNNGVGIGTSSSGGGGSGWPMWQRSDDGTPRSNSNMGLVSKLSTGIRRAARAMTKRSAVTVVSGDGTILDMESPRGNAPMFTANSDLTMVGSIDEAVCRISYVCRELLGCKVDVRDGGKKVKVEQVDRERAIWLKLSLLLSQVGDRVRVKVSQSKAEAQRSNIATLWGFYSKLEQYFRETERTGAVSAAVAL